MKIIESITYKLNAPLTAEDVARVYKSSGIKRPIDDLPRIQRMIEHADITFTAWDEHKLIGIARAITDYSYCCYLSDLAVDKTYQYKGIGKQLVRLLQEEIGEEVALLLLSSPTAMEYYPKIGFDKIDNGFKISRKR
ncbi:GNAT family N-acetyltransferase [Metabacillus malikii]|uniref:N-acetylglutamate synthase-like GNAT family acetyltransferase n=1 Tax=Metabacillus malikii TaxID=1504265 RepID=A0ABT9ZBU9_9BACI|nr:GNAT family N-acetyltransferase [Metabacillus malikii]MDQ0229312.1 N-acetylglutamate synthase-like GNAT family acetyltransferase [Metabacillus malikii]